MPEAAQIVKVDPETVQLAEEATNLELYAQSLQVVDEASDAKAKELLVKCARTMKALEAKRDADVRPLNDHVKRLNAKYKPFTEPLLRVKHLVNDKVSAYHRVIEEQMREQAAAAARKAAEEAAKVAAEQAQAKGLDEAAAAALMQQESDRAAEQAQAIERAKTTEVDGGAVSVKRPWTWEVVDEPAIPREYWILDTKKLNAVVKAGMREIPGVRIFQDYQVATKA